jgi:hypothetical protein
MNTPIDRATYALNQVLPAMSDGGFMLVTSSGQLHVPPGREAEQFADLLAHFQQLALIRAQCAEQLQQESSDTQAEGKPGIFAGWAMEDNIIGHGWRATAPAPAGDERAAHPAPAPAGSACAEPLPPVVSAWAAGQPAIGS